MNRKIAQPKPLISILLHTQTTLHDQFEAQALFLTGRDWMLRSK